MRCSSRASGTFSRGVGWNGQAVTYPNTLSGKNTREKYLMKVFRFVELDRFVKPLDECVGLKENHLPSK